MASLHGHHLYPFAHLAQDASETPRFNPGVALHVVPGEWAVGVGVSTGGGDGARVVTGAGVGAGVEMGGGNTVDDAVIGSGSDSGSGSGSGSGSDVGACVLGSFSGFASGAEGGAGVAGDSDGVGEEKSLMIFTSMQEVKISSVNLQIHSQRSVAGPSGTFDGKCTV